MFFGVGGGGECTTDSHVFFRLWTQGPKPNSVIKRDSLIQNMLYNRDGKETAELPLVFSTEVCVLAHLVSSSFCLIQTTPSSSRPNSECVHVLQRVLCRRAALRSLAAIWPLGQCGELRAMTAPYCNFHPMTGSQLFPWTHIG